MNKPQTSYPCDFCGSETGALVISGGDLLEDLPGTFQIIKCTGCGVLRQNPRLDWEDLSGYYLPGYVCHGEQLPETSRTLKDKALGLGPRKRVTRVAKYMPEGNWLDVGCGSGLILQAAQERGNWKLSGVEPVISMAEYTAARLEIDVFGGTFEDFPIHEASFDIISMWDVLEHLSAPASSIQKVSKLLKPEGIFIFSTPNLNSLDQKIFGPHWLGYDLPRHLYLFPDQLIKKYLAENDLELIDKFCFTGSYGTWYLDFSYQHKLNPTKLNTWVTKQGPDGFLYRSVSFIPLRLVDWLGLGTNITYVARKQP